MENGVPPTDRHVVPTPAERANPSTHPSEPADPRMAAPAVAAQGNTAAGGPGRSVAAAKKSAAKSPRKRAASPAITTTVRTHHVPPAAGQAGLIALSHEGSRPLPVVADAATTDAATAGADDGVGVVTVAVVTVDEPVLERGGGEAPLPIKPLLLPVLLPPIIQGEAFSLPPLVDAQALLPSLKTAESGVYGGADTGLAITPATEFTDTDGTDGMPSLTRPKRPARALRPPVVVPRRRPRVRRVTRVVRHVDTWSVFKVALVFNLFLYGVCLTAGVLLWQVAQNTGTVDNIERFFESFGWERFQLRGGEIFHSSWVAGMFVVVGLTGLAVLMATLFNLITDLVGGIRVSVLEEEVVAREERGLGWRRFARKAPEVVDAPDVD